MDIIDIILIFLLLTWTYSTPSHTVSIVDFEQVNVSWAYLLEKIKEEIKEIYYIA